MHRTLAAAIALTATLGTAGVALAQGYGAPAYGPAPYNTQYAPAPTDQAYPPTMPPNGASPAVLGGDHTNGGGSRAYQGGQKTN